ncbi:MAG: hypothetical protein R2852_07390 [Bacteroidia bacterium]
MLKQILLVAILLSLENSLCAQSLKWVNTIGGTKTDQIAKSFIDKNGDIYIVGDFEGSIDMNPRNPQILNSKGGKEVFISKLNSDGDVLWVKSIGGTEM